MRTGNNPTNKAKATDPDQSRPDVSNSNGKKEKGMTKKKAKLERTPIFKLRGEVIVWRQADSMGLFFGRPTLRIVEEMSFLTVANRDDMRSMLLSAVKGKIAHFFPGSEDFSIEIDSTNFFAAGSREWNSFDEPAWIDAVTYTCNDLDREKAIRALTYLPENHDEQVAVYG